LEELLAQQERKQFEEDTFTKIQDMFDNTLAIPPIIDLLGKEIESFIQYSTLSSIIIEPRRLVFKLATTYPISHSYVEEVKDSMLHSLGTLEKRSFHDDPVSEDTSGTITDTAKREAIASMFHLPLMMHNSVAAIITVTATKPNHFASEDIQSLQRIVRQTGKSLSKLDGVLQEERGRTQAIVGSLVDGLFMVDTQNNLQFINPTAKQLLGLHKAPITTMDVLSALPIHVDFHGKMQLALRQNQTSEISDVVIKNRQLRCGIAPVLGATGRVLGVSVLMRDETLKNSVPRMKEDFTNIIIHELRNPLTSIKASSQLLVSPVKFSPSEQEKLLHLINDQSNRLLANVEQILDAAKLEAGVFNIHKRSGNLKDVIQNVAEVFQKEAQDRVINLLIDVDHKLPAFSFDSKYLTIVLTNLLSNSLKFTSSGGTVQVTAKQKQAHVVISVADTGAGIPKDKQHKLFNKFSQIEDASANVGKGLGLYLVKGVIEAHGGTVTIDSDRGRGTTIFLTLPLTDATHIHQSADKPSPDANRMVN
jgi:signal transduction histidine kinase